MWLRHKKMQNSECRRWDAEIHWWLGKYSPDLPGGESWRRGEGPPSQARTTLRELMLAGGSPALWTPEQWFSTRAVLESPGSFQNETSTWPTSDQLSKEPWSAAWASPHLLRLKRFSCATRVEIHRLSEQNRKVCSLLNGHLHPLLRLQDQLTYPFSTFWDFQPVK